MIFVGQRVRVSLEYVAAARVRGFRPDTLDALRAGGVVSEVSADGTSVLWSLTQPAVYEDGTSTRTWQSWAHALEVVS